MRMLLLGGLAVGVALATPTVQAQTYVDPPMLVDAVSDGSLPPVVERLPAMPRVMDFADREIGRHGGQIDWIARRARDARIMSVYGYARLVGYTPGFDLVPDILEAIEVEDERRFTLHLREGHRWSDGAPFTTEDIRYWWEDVQRNEELSPYGPDSRMIVDGELPILTIIDATMARFEWSQANPLFLPALAGARPLYVYLPSHHLKPMHAAYADMQALTAVVEEAGARNWAALHINAAKLYDQQDPSLPTLQPWIVVSEPPTDRYVFERNPFFHQVDPEGRQLPYLDRVVVSIADSSLIPLKTGSGESDLQARSLSFGNIPFLKEGEERHNYTVHLWTPALGSELALYPNLTTADPVWRGVLRDVRFRRALSLAINRREINQIFYYGLAIEGNNTALPGSPQYDPERTALWAEPDIETANALLDAMGLTERNEDDLRLLPDGRPMEIIVETAGERVVEVDALQLIDESWRTIGVAAFPSNSQREVFRTRIFGGEAVMSIWMGFDNALFAPSTVPHELAPVDQNWLQYPAWGQYVQTGGDAGEAPDLDWAIRLMALYDAWLDTPDTAARMAFVDEMLDIHAEQQTSIGIVQGVRQPVVVRNTLRNVPAEGIYSWDPGAHFGMYQPSTFWLAD